jgi:hypothetical protein
MRVLATGIVLLVLITIAPAQKQRGNWPSFRGDHAAGIADGANLPEQWDAEKVASPFAISR